MEEDYWLNASDTSDDQWRGRPSSSGSGKSNSEERKSGSEGRSSEEHTRSRSRSSRSETSSREEQSGNSNETSSREEQSGNNSSGSTSRDDQDGRRSRETTSSSQNLTSSDEMKVDQQERSDHDLSSMCDLTSSTEESNDADDEVESNGDDVDAVYGDEDWTVNAMDESSSDDETQRNSSSNDDEDDEEDVSVDDEEDVGDDEFILCPKEACAKILEVEGKEEEKDVSSEEEKDVSSEEEQCRSVKLKLRIWPWQKHTSIKIFCGQKWIASKVYRLTWINHEELEELFESSFKLDICAPISANTVFRIRHCIMDFEAFMLDSPCFNELIDEFKSSVRDFRFCKKIGGEDVCRVFKCLSQGSVFALKTVRLKKSCSTEPREVEIIASLKDKRVMAFYQAWIEPWSYKNRPISNHLFIQLELCESTLKDKLSLENLESIVDTWYLFEEMAKGVKAIHDESIVHRDLKPDNVFFGSDMGVRIGDFGDACMGYDEFGGYGGTPNLGTPYYSAPELKSAEKISQEADIYSMGVMALLLFTKFKTGFERFELLRGLRDKGLPDNWVGDPDLVGDREGVRELVERMTATEPAYRPSAAEILVYLQKHDDLEQL